MNNIINPQQIYINSFLHYKDKKQFKIDEEDKEAYIYLLDKRFLKTKDIEEIKLYFQYCKVKDLDDYYYIIYTFIPLNQSNIFYLLSEKNIILSIQEFIRLLG